MKRAIFAFTLLSGAIAAREASAQLNTVTTLIKMPGLACRYYGPQANDTMLSPSGLGAVGLKNISAGAVNVACPLPVSSSRVSAVAVLYFKKSSAGAAMPNCSLYVRDGTTGTERTISPSSSSGAGTVRGYYRWTSTPVSYNHGASIYCSGLPASYIIESYGAHVGGWEDFD